MPGVAISYREPRPGLVPPGAFCCGTRLPGLAGQRIAMPRCRYARYCHCTAAAKVEKIADPNFGEESPGLLPDAIAKTLRSAAPINPKPYPDAGTLVDATPIGRHTYCTKALRSPAAGISTPIRQALPVKWIQRDARSRVYRNAGRSDQRPVSRERLQPKRRKVPRYAAVQHSGFAAILKPSSRAGNTYRRSPE